MAEGARECHVGQDLVNETGAGLLLWRHVIAQEKRRESENSEPLRTLLNEEEFVQFILV